MSKYYLGIMCGTSLDSIDISMIRCHGDKIKVIAFAEYRLKNKIKEQINILKTNTNQEIINKKLEIQVTTLIASNVIDFLKKHKINKSLISAIGFAGITLNHSPHLGKSTYLGDPKKLSSILSIPIIADFRQTDIDAGGQGAPLTGFFHKYLNDTMNSSITYINLGGFANISFEESKKRIAFDICPVNIVLNHYVNQLDFDYDDEGKIAKSGKLNTSLLSDLNSLLFYNQEPPKSLSLEWVQQIVIPIIEGYNIETKDILRTFVEHAAIQISEYLNQNETIALFTGGGVYNLFLIERIKILSNSEVIIPNTDIIEYKEALVFGLLGVLKVRNEVNCLKSVTGAKKNHSSGKIFNPKINV